MKLSELIQAAETALAKHGDMPVEVKSHIFTTYPQIASHAFAGNIPSVDESIKFFVHDNSSWAIVPIEENPDQLKINLG